VELRVVALVGLNGFPL